MPSMWKRTLLRPSVILASLMIVACALLLIPQAHAQEGTTTHVVAPGENLYLIATRYGVTVREIMIANGLRNPNVIYVGQKLIIPVPPTPQPEITGTVTATPTPAETVHVVRRGETLFSIAQRYGVTVGEILRANGLRNANFIYVGQRLVIPNVPAPTTLPPQATPGATPTPAPTQVTPTETPSPEASPTPPPVSLPTTAIAPIAAPVEAPGVEVIIISNPAPNQTVVSPVTVTGIASAFEQQITVRILDEAGNEVGLGVGFIDADLGQRGPFTATVPFNVPLHTQFGRIQVYSVSPRDGAVEHLNSVTVRLQGLDIETVLEMLRGALEAKDYDDLKGFMPAEGFSFARYQSEGTILSPDEMVQQLSEQYLGPGQVTMDPTVDGKEILEGRVAFPPAVRWVAYSTGWGSEGKDEAFLLITERNGRAFWGGLLYVPAELVDYR